MEGLIVRLRIEEDNRGSEKKVNVATEKANMVEHAQSSKAKKTNSGKGAKLAPKRGRHGDSEDDLWEESDFNEFNLYA